MKKLNLVFVIMILWLLSSCIEKDDINTKYIFAGATSEELIVQSYSPALKVEIDTSVIKFLPAVYSGDLLIDLDHDNYNDIKFCSSIGRDISMSVTITTTKVCEIASIQDDVEVEILTTPLRLGDNISHNLDWRIVGTKVEGNVLIDPVILSSYQPASTNSMEIANNSWDNESLYLAIRVKKDELYKFGWIGLNIDDFYKCKIREIGFEK